MKLTLVTVCLDSLALEWVLQLLYVFVCQGNWKNWYFSAK